MRKLLMHPLAKPVVFLLCLLPFFWLFYGAATNNLGANPAEYLIRSTGDWTLRFLCIVLAVTPLRVLTSTPQLARLRRMLGLFVYFYVVLHLLSYSWFDMGFDVPDIAKDIAKRPFILVGFSAFVLLTPLAAPRSTVPSRRWGANAGNCCTGWCTPLPGWGCCTFSGCGRARTTSGKWLSMLRSCCCCWAGG